jgi:hypothetical protein
MAAWVEVEELWQYWAIPYVDWILSLYLRAFDDCDV